MAETGGPEAINRAIFNEMDRLHDNYARSRDRLASGWLKQVVGTGGETDLKGFIALMHAIDWRNPQNAAERDRVKRYFEIDGRFARPDKPAPLAYVPDITLGQAIVESFGILNPGRHSALTYTIEEPSPAVFKGTVALQLNNVYQWAEGDMPTHADEASFTLVTAIRQAGQSIAEDSTGDILFGMDKIWGHSNPAGKMHRDALMSVERLAYFMARTGLST